MAGLRTAITCLFSLDERHPRRHRHRRRCRYCHRPGIAGIWTFYHFVKGRVFKPRLTLQGRAHHVRIHAGDYVVCSITVSNVGLSQVRRVIADVVVYALSGDGRHRVRLGGDKILRSHEWFEPASVVSEQVAIPRPAGTAPVAADFRVVVTAQGWFEKRTTRTTFSTSTIEEVTPQNHLQQHEE
jgi:hypothetical protein